MWFIDQQLHYFLPLTSPSGNNWTLCLLQEEKLPEVPYSRILALNKPEFCYIAFGVIASAIGGAVTPAFAVLFGKIIGVS